MIGIRPKTSRKVYKTSRSQPNEGCAFCALLASDPGIVRDETHFFVIKNKYPYLLWDGQRVTDHILIVPKKHRHLLDEFSAAEFREYVRLVAEYDKLGYNTYSRGKDSSARTIPHQHTHLIRMDNKPLRLLIFLRRPYGFWYR